MARSDQEHIAFAKESKDVKTYLAFAKTTRPKIDQLCTEARAEIDENKKEALFAKASGLANEVLQMKLRTGRAIRSELGGPAESVYNLMVEQNWGEASKLEDSFYFPEG